MTAGAAHTPCHAPPTHAFETPLGVCSIGWSDDGVCAVHLPPVPAATLARPTPRPPSWVRGVVRRLVRHLEGREPDPLLDVPVDLGDLSGFERAVLEGCRATPPGEVTTYGALAGFVGRPGAARAVGRALGRNPVPLVVPCHRVVAAAGRPGGYSGPGGLALKGALLAIEGVTLPGLRPSGRAESRDGCRRRRRLHSIRLDPSRPTLPRAAPRRS